MDKAENLRNLIADNGLKLGFVAKKLGLSYSNFWLRLKGETKFNQDEVRILVDLLKIPSDKIFNFF